MTGEETLKKEDSGKPGNSENLNLYKGVAIYVVQGFWLIVLLLIFMAVMQLYFTIPEIIAIWFSNEYAPLVRAVYFIAIIITGVFFIYKKFMTNNQK